MRPMTRGRAWLCCVFSWPRYGQLRCGKWEFYRCEMVSRSCRRVNTSKEKERGGMLQNHDVTLMKQWKAVVSTR